ncbi:hypothetical protein SUNI508_11717, partial [Seiridium unicorne]
MLKPLQLWLFDSATAYEQSAQLA